MSDVKLTPISLSDRKGVDRFIRVQWHIYREASPSSRWVPPLMMDRRDFLNTQKNPFFEHAECCLWVAEKDGRDVGRIAAVVDHDYTKYRNEQVGLFGMFESPKDPEIANALLDAAASWLQERSCTVLNGPMDFSTNYPFGTLIDAFDRDPGINMPYNPPYYDELFAGAGLSKVKDVYQWEIDLTKPIPERIGRLAEKVRKRDRIDVRRIDIKDWDNEVQRTLDVYNEAWTDNWGFVPVGAKEYAHIAKDLKMVMHPSLGFIAEVDGEPIAFALTIMNVNPSLKKLDGNLFPFGLFRLLWDLKVKNAVNSGRLILLGIRKGYRRRGVDALLIAETHKAAAALGWPNGEIGWTLEDNEMINRAIASMGGKKAATYRVYGRELS